MNMNQNLLFQLLVVGMSYFVMLSTIVYLYKRLRTVEKEQAEMMLEWHVWAACKIQDYPTARMTAAMLQKKSSAGALSPILQQAPAEKKHKLNPKTDLIIKQTG